MLLRKKLFARSALELSNQSIYNRSAFLSVLTSHPTTPARYRMSEAEAHDYLDALVRARSVVPVGDHIYTNPKDVIDAVHLKCGLPIVPLAAPSLEERRKALLGEVTAAMKANMPVLRQVVQKERDLWALTAVGSGAQMLTLSYLTFRLYGWDVMEPVCFFVTSGTALLSYGYFLYFRSEHSYSSVDDNLVPHRLTSHMAGTNFDSHRALRGVTALKDVHAALSHSDKKVAEMIKEALPR